MTPNYVTVKTWKPLEMYANPIMVGYINLWMNICIKCTLYTYWIMII